MMARAVGDGSTTAALAWLGRTVEPGNRYLWAYVEDLGPVEVAAQLRAGDGPNRLQESAGARAQTDSSMLDLEKAAANGIRLLGPTSAEWPGDTLANMALACANGEANVVPPLSLWVRGRASLAQLAARSVAVVGARAATAYGMHVAAELAAGCAERGYTIVSGGAYGIDIAAHRGAVANGQPTVALLACGVDRPYPAGNQKMLEAITRDGLLVSEFPPGSAPMRQRFLVRNRLIAGLSLGTVVVEAALRSGARSTAARARELGRPVMAVPGPVTSALSGGCLQLLREGGAIPVGTAAHVIDAVGQIGDDLAPVESGPVLPEDALSADVRAILEAVPVRRPAPVESIAQVGASDVSRALAALTQLELIGLVECIDGQWRRTKQLR